MVSITSKGVRRVDETPEDNHAPIAAHHTVKVGRIIWFSALENSKTQHWFLVFQKI